jgi:hypothetical protein
MAKKTWKVELNDGRTATVEAEYMQNIFRGGMSGDAGDLKFYNQVDAVSYDGKPTKQNVVVAYWPFGTFGPVYDVESVKMSRRRPRRKPAAPVPADIFKSEEGDTE